MTRYISYGKKVKRGKYIGAHGYYLCVKVNSYGYDKYCTGRKHKKQWSILNAVCATMKHPCEVITTMVNH